MILPLALSFQVFPIGLNTGLINVSDFCPRVKHAWSKMRGWPS